MKTIVHIPSWYPHKSNRIAGIFSEKLIRSIADIESGHYNHIILNWHDSEFASLKRPFKFIKTAFNYLLKPKITKQETGNITTIKFNIFRSHTKLFGNSDTKIINTVHKYLSDHKSFDLIHAQVSYIGGHIANLCSETLEKKYILTEHMTTAAYDNFTAVNQEKIKKAISNSSLLIPVSNYHNRLLKNLADVDSKVIPNVIEAKEFSEVKKNNDIKDTVQLITVGILSHRKGIKNLLDAVKIVIESTDFQIHLKVYGTGEILNELVAYSKNIGVNNNIEWLGNVPRSAIIKGLLKSTIYVCSSLEETFGVAPVEAMACGIPIVSTDCGGPSDYINSTTGLIAKGVDAESLAAEITKMISNISNYKPAEIRKFYLNNFSSSVVGAQYIKIYNDLIAPINKFK